MKLILYLSESYGWIHPKNYDAIKRMCNVYNIEFEETTSVERIMLGDYDMLLSTKIFIDPAIIPPHIKIIFGPHFFVFPSDPIVGKYRDGLEKRCVYNTLSEWNKKVHYEIAPDIIMPLVAFPFGVDTEYYKPLETRVIEYDCTLYFKHRSIDIINATINLLEHKNLRYNIIVYGKYNQDDYIKKIRTSKFMVVIDGHESQGFALQEAMSCNTPLLVVDATTMYDEMADGLHSTYHSYYPKQLAATSVPYWSDECGIKIQKLDQLDNALDTMLTNYTKYNPRKYVENNLSDKICMKRIMDYFNI